MKCLWGFGLASLLSSCATVESGSAFDWAAAQGFESGVATRSQIEAALGPPLQSSRNADGSSVITYVHIVSSANGLSGRSQADGRTAAFVFDADGVLQRSSFARPSSDRRVH